MTLTSARNSSIELIEFTYDWTDRRVAKTVSGGTPYRYFNRFAESADGLLTKYYYVGDRLIATREAQNSQFSEVAPGVAPHPEPWVLPPAVLYALGGAVLLLLVAPGRGRRCMGVAVVPSRALGVAVAFLVGTSPFILGGDCDPGGPGDNAIYRYHHFDHLGSLQAVTKENGTLAYQIRYWAYGEIRGRFNGVGSPIAAIQDFRYEFTGYETEFESGLEYAGARFYDPEIAQFLSHDPADEWASPYAYGPWNPINGIDPTGAQWEQPVTGASGGEAAGSEVNAGAEAGGSVAGSEPSVSPPVAQSGSQATPGLAAENAQNVGNVTQPTTSDGLENLGRATVDGVEPCPVSCTITWEDGFPRYHYQLPSQGQWNPSPATGGAGFLEVARGPRVEPDPSAQPHRLGTTLNPDGTIEKKRIPIAPEEKYRFPGPAPLPPNLDPIQLPPSRPPIQIPTPRGPEISPPTIDPQHVPPELFPGLARAEPSRR